MKKATKTTQAADHAPAALMADAAASLDDAANALAVIVRALSSINGQADIRLEVLSDRETAYRAQAGELRAAIA